MATKAVNETPVQGERGPGVIRAIWSELALGDDGQAIEIPRNSDKSVQVEGTAGGGGTIIVEGSNDGVNYRQLRDPFGTPINLGGGTIAAILENPFKLRPRVSGGDGTTNLTVTLIATKQT